MKGLDTNVIVRYLVQDDLDQWKLADEYIKHIKVDGDVCFINNIVLCELVWLLKSSYKMSRNEIIDIIEKILRTDIFDFENTKAAWWALQQMKNGRADFSDYLIAKINLDAGCSETVTFDVKLQGAEGIRLFR